ncbi:Acetyl-/propionyl-coenzyme A carboxylase alpha chain [compost metagenome]
MITRPFDTLLVANRGEIALRVIRSARRLGLRTVAVYSDADRDALHVRAADQALYIGAAPARDSYLNIDAILAAAERSGAQAIHPGYGFLSENAEFAARVEQAGLVFVGPPARVIEAMGNKARAKDLMEASDVPTVPGFRGEGASDGDFIAAADRVGYPLMVKAAAGGGGRGMRIVREAAELPAALASARSEAQAAFGCGELLLERAVIRPRHIELQVLADSHGNVVHLGERDCSVQRRHQKLIEETPSPVVDETLRERMAATAVAAARSIGYVGAGTLEFLLDESGAFYFMEMNTRLQVEHPVTEAVTGLDLVEWQLRIAAGEALGFTQEDVRFHGHAIEVRLCAEAPESGFLPQSGPVLAWQPPAPGGDLRIDHALCSGGQISPYYDSMIAKLVAHGTDRAEAVRKLAAGLEQCVLLGTPSNQAFLIDCLRHPLFRAGRAHTGFIAEQFPSVAPKPLPAPLLALALASELAAPEAGLQRGQPARLRYRLGDAELDVRLVAGPDAAEVELDGRRLAVRHLSRETPGIARRIVGEVDGERLALTLASLPDALLLAHAGLSWRLERPDALAREASAGSDGSLNAPMSARVIEVAVRNGERVAAGDLLMVIEAMKMEHRLCARIAGVVEGLELRVGDQTRTGQTLARILAEEVPA